MNARYEDFGKFLEMWFALHLDNPKVDPYRIKANLDVIYSSAGRYYHNATHINDGLVELDSVRDLTAKPEEVEVAWYFHDVVYDSKAKDNEEKSAELARKVLADSGVNLERISRVGNLVLATKHLIVPTKRDAQVLVDIDLSILGKSGEVFDEYESNIRKEYSWVPEDQFRAGRKAVLRAFSKRPILYSTEFFRDKYEDKARENLARSINQLSG